MFGRVSKEKVVANVRSALDSLSLKFDEQEDGT